MFDKKGYVMMIHRGVFFVVNEHVGNYRKKKMVDNVLMSGDENEGFVLLFLVMVVHALF
jgi:hypothetical protein